VIYCKTITALVTAPVGQVIDADLPVTDGLIYQFELYFPPGSSGLLFVRVADGGFPVWPSEPGEWFYGDNTLITFPDRYYIAAPDHKFKVWYYNLDDTYDHKFTVRIGQVSSELFIQSFIPTYGQKNMDEQIAGLLADQEEKKRASQDALIQYFSGVSEPETSEGGG